MNNEYTRDEVIDLTIEQVDAWRKTPEEELYDSPDHSVNGVPYPSTKVENELVELLHIYLMEESWRSDPLLNDIAGALGALDTGVNSSKRWEYLFELADELLHTERPQKK
jgi:hypothetical protein